MRPMISLTSCALAIICLFCSPAVAQPKGQAPEGEARAIATAVLVHDRSIRSALWKQTATHNASDGEKYPCESTQGFDSMGRWFCTYQDVGLLRSSGKKVMGKGRIVSDGALVVGLDDVGQSALVSEVKSQRNNQLGFDCWLGRYIDHEHHRRLGELLLDSRDLKLLSPTCVQGTVSIAGRVSILEVEVDLEHGGSLKRITVRDAALRVPFQVYHIEQFVEVDGKWLPMRASLVTRKIDIDPDQMQRFEKALADARLARHMDYTDPAVQAAYHAVVAEVFGQNEAPSSELVSPITLEVEYQAINSSIPESAFSLSIPVDYRGYDGVRDMVKAKGSSEWRAQK